MQDQTTKPSWRSRKEIRFLGTPAGLMLAAILTLSLIPLIQPELDPDFWWHLRAGQILLSSHHLIGTDPFTFSGALHPWVMAEWGWEALLAGVISVGGSGLVIMSMGAITYLGLMLIVLRTRLISKVGVGAVFAGILVMVVAGMAIWGPRVQMITFTLIAVTLYLVERHLTRGDKRIWVLLPIFLLWSNLHSGFTFGLILLVVTLAIEGGRVRWGQGGEALVRRLRTLLWVTLGCFLVVMINPNGPQILVYALETVTSPVQQANILEWKSPNFHNLNSQVFEFMFFTLLLMVGITRKINLREGLFALLGLGLALQSVRNIVIFLVLAGPLWMIQADLVIKMVGAKLRGNITKKASRPTNMGALVTAIVAVAGLLLTAFAVNTAIANGDGSLSAATNFPVCATRWLTQANAPNNLRIFNEYSAGGYLVYHLAPKGDKIFIFGDAALMGDSLVQESVDAEAGAPDWQYILNNAQSDLVLFPSKSALASILSVDKDYTRVYQDQTTVGYEPTNKVSRIHFPAQPDLVGVCAQNG